MKLPIFIALLLLTASCGFADRLVGDWVEVETGLGMTIKEKGIVILNSRGENPISGSWSKPEENKLKIEYSVNGNHKSGLILYIFRDGFLVFPSQNGPGDKEEVYKRSAKKTKSEQVGAGQPR